MAKTHRQLLFRWKKKKTAESQGSALQFATGMNKKSRLWGFFLFLFFFFFVRKISRPLSAPSLHIHTRRSGELQKNRHGNHKAWIVKRHKESPIPILNSHLAMKQQNDTW